ncbi:enoyl-CoA hydratase/carnithine racemase [Corynebacterium epidermidicanis]|uniref:Enoyl-CoA hydratase/carnithine racemase n=1 Tax=Corynebacterium epidermidicanis TaxID=1050174 RepID=A0A0G3GNC9_9CORY|nr:enoyl-CoA hydratase/carnithine racemase [Corynebacterium epidermidicanis]
MRAYAQASTGILELNRPRAINAINGEMVDIITPALEDWRDDPEIHRVLIFSNSERGFCAGGDIREVRDHAIEGDHEFGDQYLQKEYTMNKIMANFPKPYVALIDGVVMGGGLGASAHGSHRVITEKAFAAMPEMAIGFVPDVGISYMMTHMVGEEGRKIPALATFAGLTGYRLSAADMLYTGLATHFVPSKDLAEFQEMLIAESIDEALEKYAGELDEEPRIREFLPEIEACFSKGTWAEIDAALNECENEEFVDLVRDLMSNANPSSVVASAEMYAVNTKVSTVEEAIHNEYEIGYLLRREPNFAEGIRAVLVDKDRNPSFVPATYDEVDAAKYHAVLN